MLSLIEKIILKYLMLRDCNGVVELFSNLAFRARTVDLLQLMK